jgi:hypothetical protein
MTEMATSLRVHSASNMKQILLGIIMYANNHKGEFPPDLPTMQKEQKLSFGTMADPLDPEQKLGFTYVPPPSTWHFGQKDDATFPILYEQFAGGHYVGYADGHVEWFATRADVEERFKKRQAR